MAIIPDVPSTTDQPSITDNPSMTDVPSKTDQPSILMGLSDFTECGNSHHFRHPGMPSGIAEFEFSCVPELPVGKMGSNTSTRPLQGGPKADA